MLEIERLHRRVAGDLFRGLVSLRNGFHDDFPCCRFIDLFDETCVPPDSWTLGEAFEDQLK